MDDFPYVWRGEVGPGHLMTAIAGSFPRAFRELDQPPERGGFVCVVPVRDFWRLSAANTRKHDAKHFTECFDPALIDALRHRGKLIFDLSNEGPIFNQATFDLVHNWLSEHNIDRRRVAFVSQNRMLDAIYRRHYGVGGIRLLSFDFFILQAYLMCELTAACTPLESKRPTHSFICQNYTPRPHRIMLMLAMIEMGILANGLVSFAGLDTEKLTVGAELSGLAAIGDVDRLKQFIPALIARGRMIIDDFSSGGNSLALDLAPESYQRAHLAVVTESDFLSGEVKRITEKSIKPLFSSRPILLFGNPHSLALMRELGFQTFTPLVDESYDAVTDPVFRFGLLTDELRRFASMPPPELAYFSDAVDEICRFNRDFLLKHATTRYRRLYLSPITEWLRM
jgi:hypothetical protein